MPLSFPASLPLLRHSRLALSPNLPRSPLSQLRVAGPGPSAAGRHPGVRPGWAWLLGGCGDQQMFAIRLGPRRPRPLPARGGVLLTPNFRGGGSAAGKPPDPRFTQAGGGGGALWGDPVALSWKLPPVDSSSLLPPLSSRDLVERGASSDSRHGVTSLRLDNETRRPPSLHLESKMYRV